MKKVTLRHRKISLHLDYRRCTGCDLTSVIMNSNRQMKKRNRNGKENYMFDVNRSFAEGTLYREEFEHNAAVWSLCQYSRRKAALPG